VAFFEGPLRHALHRLKYRRDVILADALARVLAEGWQAWALPGEVVIPIPLSERRLRERGYNQAGLLAGAFAELTQLHYAPEAITRIRHTESQVNLTAAQRQTNVSGAFQAQARRVAGRAIVLIDDVCTTGATLVAAAEAVRAAGATEVWGFTLGRAYHRSAPHSHLSLEAI
jgi:ComF family protein